MVGFEKFNIHIFYIKQDFSLVKALDNILGMNMTVAKKKYD